MSKVEKIKQHIKNNKLVYIVTGSTVVVVVVAGVAYYVGRNVGAAKAIANAATEITGETVISNAPIMNNIDCINPVMNVLQFVDNSNPSRPIAMLGEDGGIMKAWNSISEAAKDLDVDKRLLSKAVNNIVDNVNGMKFAAVDTMGNVAA